MRHSFNRPNQSPTSPAYVPYFGYVREAQNPAWGCLSLGPLGYFYWMRRSVRRKGL